jgi:hypothetical protein
VLHPSHIQSDVELLSLSASAKIPQLDPVDYPNFLPRSSLTIAGLACPLDAFMT